MGSSRPLGVGLLGYGRIARIAHLNILQGLPDVSVVAIAESDARSREEAAKHAPAARMVADFAELLADDGIDAVVVSLPPALHSEAAVAAMRAGKHIYIEKPLAIELNAARAVLVEQARTGLVAMLGFNFRFHPLYIELRRQLREGRIGFPVGARTVFCAAARALPQWKTTRKTGGGVLLDLASHHIDITRYLFEQEVAEVWATARSIRTEHDTVSLHLRLQDGLLVQSFFSMTAAEEDRFEIYGDRGRILVDRYRGGAPEFSPASRAAAGVDRFARGLSLLGRVPGQVRNALRPAREESYRSALCCFIEAVRAGKPAAIHLDDGMRSLAAVLAAEESVRRGVAVTPRVDAQPGAIPSHGSGRIGEAAVAPPQVHPSIGLAPQRWTASLPPDGA